MIQFNDVNVKLPVAHDYDKPCAEYYLVDPIDYAPFLAMYLKKDGEDAWYINYCAKVIVDINGWISLNE